MTESQFREKIDDKIRIYGGIPFDENLLNNINLCRQFADRIYWENVPWTWIIPKTDAAEKVIKEFRPKGFNREKEVSNFIFEINGIK